MGASRPAGLDGGEQAQRNRAMCNRQHKFPPAQRRVFGLQALECLGTQHIIAISLVWRKTDYRFAGKRLVGQAWRALSSTAGLRAFQEKVWYMTGFDSEKSMKEKNEAEPAVIGILCIQKYRD